MTRGRCFVCGKPVRNPCRADTHEDQVVLVGSECFRMVRFSGDEGYLPPAPYVGPRLWTLTRERIQYFEKRGMM